MRAFARMLAGDVRCSLRGTFPRLAAVAAIAAFLAFAVWSDIWRYLDEPVGISLGDALLGVLGGMPLYRPETGNEFVFPMAWFALLSVTAYVTLDWPLRDLGGFGARLIVVSGSRRQWWLAKCCWTVLCAVAVWLIVLAACAVLVLATGGSWTAAPSVDAVFALGFDGFGTGFEFGSLAGFALAVPLVLAALLLVQLFVSLVAGPYVALGATVSILFMSAFYMSPALIGEYLMGARSAVVLANGVDPLAGAALSLGIALLVVVGGGALFVRKDILGRRDS